MKKIVYTNSSGEELVLTNSPPFRLITFEETESVNLYTAKGANQDGVSYLGNTIGIKDITIGLTVIADSEVELIRYRNMAYKTLNPKLGEGYLTYTDDSKERKIKCIVNKLPVFNTISGHHGKEGKASSGLISITAHKPFWTDLVESKNEIVMWFNDLQFPLELIPGGIEFGHRMPSLIVNVLNDGDVEIGMRIELKALASVINPSLINVNTSKFIKINKTMALGEVLNIETYFGGKKIDSIIDGATRNAFNFMDYNSDFLQLAVGDNLFRYNADGGLDNLEVSIYYNPQYLGV